METPDTGAAGTLEVRKNRPGSRTARLLCDSAAKLTTVSIDSSASTAVTAARSPMSPSTRRTLDPRSARLAGFPA